MAKVRNIDSTKSRRVNLFIKLSSFASSQFNCELNDEDEEQTSPLIEM